MARVAIEIAVILLLLVVFMRGAFFHTVLEGPPTSNPVFAESLYRTQFERSEIDFCLELQISEVFVASGESANRHARF